MIYRAVTIECMVQDVRTGHQSEVKTWIYAPRVIKLELIKGNWAPFTEINSVSRSTLLAAGNKILNGRPKLDWLPESAAKESRAHRESERARHIVVKPVGIYL